MKLSKIILNVCIYEVREVRMQGRRKEAQKREDHEDTRKKVGEGGGGEKSKTGLGSSGKEIDRV